MPEFPEVYTVVEKLKEITIGKVIKRINIFYKNVFYDYNDEIKNLTIKDVRQYGKFILFFIDNYVLLSHLRMEGKYIPSNEILNDKHILLNFEFSDGSYLNYHDTRKFGRFDLRRIENYLKTPPLMNLSKTPYKISVNELLDKFKNRTTKIKQILLEQDVILGIGNIYADEILFKSKISPFKIAKKITKSEAERIIENAKEIFDLAIKSGGTTIYSYSALGNSGHFQDFLNVHLRENKPCTLCGSLIKKTKINGRGTYYCDKCQKE